MMLLTVKEYDRLHIRRERNLSAHAISQEDGERLASIRIKDTPVFRYGNRCLVAQHWVGMVSLPDFSIEILPKIYGGTSAANLRRVLLRMILVSRKIPPRRHLNASVCLQRQALSEFLIETFLYELGVYCQSGLQHSYRNVKGNLDKIKGRILFNQQFKRNILNPTRFYCRYTRYSEDCDLNRFFKSCLLLAGEITRDTANRKRIEELLSYFDGISEISREDAKALFISFTLVNAHAETAYQYGRLLLDGLGATFHVGSTRLSTMLFDMNQIYELFIYQTAEKIYKHRIIYQKRGNYMVYRNSDHQHFISLRPDLTLLVDANTKWIIDTKWKILRSFAKEGDVYQMNAYADAIPYVKKVILLYPKTEGCEHILGRYTMNTSIGESHPLEIKAVDVMQCLEWQGFLHYFQRLIEE